MKTIKFIQMKKIMILFFGVAFIFSGCATHKQLTNNINNHSTEVVLSKKNFTVTNSVMGESKTMHVFGFGGLNKKALVEDARSKMMAKADIVGGSKAIAYETIEMKREIYFVVSVYKVIVSGYIVEFTE